MQVDHIVVAMCVACAVLIDDVPVIAQAVDEQACVRIGRRRCTMVDEYAHGRKAAIQFRATQVYRSIPHFL